MKIKNKGKVYPSPSSSSSLPSSSTCSNGAAAAAGGGGGGGGDYLSVLKLLPAAIIALVSVLPLEDREVLAYLIMRSMKTTTVSSSSAVAAVNPNFVAQKKPSKRIPPNSGFSGGGGGGNSHKASGLYCDCFDCYTSFWFRWDSSPNRELIHQAIEAFEDHLTNGETHNSKKNSKGKRKDKTARRSPENNNKQEIEVVVPVLPGPARPDEISLQVEETEQASSSVTTVFAAAAAADVFPENEPAPAGSTEKEPGSAEDNDVVEVSNESSPAEEVTTVVRTSPTAVATSCSTHHKGLARKVLPDVLGLFNSRLWSLWSPNA